MFICSANKSPYINFNALGITFGAGEKLAQFADDCLYISVAVWPLGWSSVWSKKAPLKKVINIYECGRNIKYRYIVNFQIIHV